MGEILKPSKKQPRDEQRLADDVNGDIIDFDTARKQKSSSEAQEAFLNLDDWEQEYYKECFARGLDNCTFVQTLVVLTILEKLPGSKWIKNANEQIYGANKK